MSILSIRGRSPARLSGGLRLVAHRSMATPLTPSWRTIRPSLLDARFNGDAWILASGEGPLALCLGTYELVRVRALPLEVPALNQLLGQARQRRPRGRPLP